MNKFTLLMIGVALIVIGGPIPAQAVEKRGGSEADYRQIEALVDRLVVAFTEQDATTVADIYDSNARLMSGGVPSQVADAGLKERMEQSFAEASSVFETTIEEIEVGGELGFIVGLYAMGTTKADGATQVVGGRFFLVVHRTDRGWKIWRDIDNLTPDADALIAKLKADAVP